MPNFKKLTEVDIIKIIFEEWERKLSNLIEDAKIDFFVNLPARGEFAKKEKIIISPGLKVRHKRSHLLYTVVDVNSKRCILRTPEGKDFLVSVKKMENDYEVD